mgnify:CR=1 FL=1
MDININKRINKSANKINFTFISNIEEKIIPIKAFLELVIMVKYKIKREIKKVINFFIGTLAVSKIRK